MKKFIRILKKIFLIFAMMLLAFWGYVEIINRNSVNMTFRQKILKAIYPVWMWWTKAKGKNITSLANDTVQPPVSFYSLQSIQNNGAVFDFEKLRGKKVLLVNTASDCGYTHQYDDLQKLSQQFPDKLMVLGFPANDFKEQEKGTDEEIAEFCRLNYGVSFPMMQKSVVKKGKEQHPVFQWLTDSTKNGWCNKQPSWNFSKYIVNEEGMLTHYFGSSISPLSDAFIRAIEK